MYSNDINSWLNELKWIANISFSELQDACIKKEVDVFDEYYEEWDSREFLSFLGIIKD